MKTYIKYIFVAMLTLVSMSCSDKISEYKEVNLRISISLNNYNGVLENPIKIKLTNYSGLVGSIKEYKVNTLGDILLENLMPGQYGLSVSGMLTEEEGYQILGTRSEFLVKAGLTGIEAFDYNESKTINVKLEQSRLSPIIFKEIYYSGSRYTNSANKLTNYFYDQYYEVYNNSNEVVYLDKLCISNLYPNSGLALPFANNMDRDNLFGQATWMVPGSGQDTPLAPGKSAVITLSGRNHKEVSVELIDLSTSDFECYVKKAGGKAPLDYPVPNMIPAHWPATTAQWLTATQGAAMVLYRLDYPFDPTDTHLPIGVDKGGPFIRIPKSSILDAVECVKDITQGNMKRIPTNMDAGIVTVGQLYIGKSVARKIKETTSDGRIIFQDTNNSSDDFEIMDTPQIRRYLQ